MRSFNIHTGKVVPLMDDNINTDQILPSRFLSRVEKTGFGKFLFANWRYIENSDEEGDQFEDDPDFVLNFKEYQGASILVTGDNFAGGSSREHAVWALDDFGIRTVIAGGFSDIFYNNSFKNGLLAITLPLKEREYLAQVEPDVDVTVDLSDQEIRVKNHVFHFDIPEDVKYKLLNGVDDIMETMEYTDEIEDYEEKWESFYSYK